MRQRVGAADSGEVRVPKGEAVDGKQFFALLYEDSEFCKQLGRAMLAAGQLETELKKFLRSKAPALNTERATLGQMVKILKEKDLLTKMQPHLDLLARQRNYLAHNIHSLLSDWIEETILERSDLLDSDVHTYKERAWQLTENLNALATILERENSFSNTGPSTSSE